MFHKLKKYLQEARQEFRHVNWPTTSEGMRLTAIVIFISIGISILLGMFDYLFSYGLKTFFLQ